MKDSKDIIDEKIANLKKLLDEFYGTLHPAMNKTDNQWKDGFNYGVYLTKREAVSDALNSMI